ncbi:uncharacterized protein A1O9_01023 [Exophiala aquamarina CBS 119918]|uniref:Autophagy-related protein 28 n=1 Tax=Exophiala aquamarina CBS 119918 TaxID=1182545 RepID=A0A072PTG0_9EURO|nr:uncharacterized protein A1O9_01023 [Exophiala aquamarina CBS 119918]KEF63047.1 hypothetical protein A1O9_01023 [Exophiala aquamarina CBS 119918]
MNKSFIERIFPQSPGSRLPQYEYDYAPSSSGSPASPPRIALQESTLSSLRSRGGSSSPQRARSQHLSPSLVRHDDPFLSVERASKSLERILQTLLDAQSEGLSAGIGSDEGDEVSSVGSPTPTPSAVTPTSRRDSGLKTIPIRQPKPKKLTLRGARKGLGKSMREFADLKRHELRLIEKEVAARDQALKQASDLGNQRSVLDDKIYRIQHEENSAGLQSEVQKVEQEIRELENTLFELKARHRHLTTRLREEDSTKGSKLSSYNESVRLNESQARTFLRHPPIVQGLRPNFAGGMYALKPERRTLQMAQEQWTAEVELLNLRKSDVENEKTALVEGSALWRDAVHRIHEFEKELKAQTRDLSQSQLQSYSGDPALAKMGLKASMQVILSKLSTLTSELERDLKWAEDRNWNLLICSIGAELAALEQAKGILTETSAFANWEIHHTPGDGAGINGDTDSLIDDDQDAPHEDLLNELSAATAANMKPRSRSPGETSNQSLEDTLREFGTDANEVGMSTETEKEKLSLKATAVHEPMSESEDDDPGPDFFLSH